MAGASYKTAKPKQIKSGGVVGAGTMGTGIAMSMLNSGIPVVLLEQNKEVNDTGEILIPDCVCS